MPLHEQRATDSVRGKVICHDVSGSPLSFSFSSLVADRLPRCLSPSLCTFNLSWSHFPLLCHSLHHILKPSLPHSTAFFTLRFIRVMTDAWNSVPWLDWHWWKTTSAVNKHWADKLCFLFSYCSSHCFLHFFKIVPSFADSSVPQSCHRHQTQYLFSVRNRISLQITSEQSTDNVSPWSCLPSRW